MSDQIGVAGWLPTCPGRGGKEERPHQPTSLPRDLPTPTAVDSHITLTSLEVGREAGGEICRVIGRIPPLAARRSAVRHGCASDDFTNKSRNQFVGRDLVAGEFLPTL